MDAHIYSLDKYYLRGCDVPATGRDSSSRKNTDRQGMLPSLEEITVYVDLTEMPHSSSLHRKTGRPTTLQNVYMHMYFCASLHKTLY